MSQQPGHIAAVSAFSLALVGDKDIVCRVCLSSCFFKYFPPFLKFSHYKNIYTEWNGDITLICFLLSKFPDVDASELQHVSIVHFFLLIGTIPHCVCTKICLIFHLLKEIWADYSFGCDKLCCCKHSCTYFCVYTVFISLG